MGKSSGLIALVLGGIGLLALSKRGGAVDSGTVTFMEGAPLVEHLNEAAIYPAAEPGVGFIDPYVTDPFGQPAISYWFPGIGVVSKEGYEYLQAARLEMLAEGNAGGG